MTPDSFHTFAEELLSQTLTHYPLRRTPILKWKNYRVTAGTANYRNWEITLSAQVLKSTEQIRVTLLHEYAHLLAVERGGVRAANHGKEWKRAMLELGQEPKVRHNYDVVRNVVEKSHFYECKKCAYVFQRSRPLAHNRVYKHVKCGGELRRIPPPKATNDSVA